MINISDFDREDLWLYCMTESIFTILDIYDDILEEGACKTNKKRKLDKYLSKYNYKGDKNEGTIEVDGKTYNIKRNMPQTAAYLGIPDDKKHILLDKNFEKLKNNKRRDAILQHEIGHSNLHHLYHDNTVNGRNLARKNMGLDGHDYDDILTKNMHESKTEKEKIRDKNIDVFKKYDVKDNNHANPMEYEADAYARAHKNGDHIKRALRDAEKQNKKSSKEILNKHKNLSNKEKTEMYHNYNKELAVDLKARSKVMKDKNINLNAYK